MKKLTREYFQKQGSIGGKKSSANMTPEQRKERAKKALEARWKKLSTRKLEEDLQS